MNQFCCSIFSTAFDDAGQKGLSIIVVKEKSDYHFLLQSRGASYSEQENECFVVQQGIVYCPWCGTHLSKNVKDGANMISEKLDSHDKFYIGIR